MELTVLRAHPGLWRRYPDGDLSAMPHAVLAELWTHARAEDDAWFRRLAVTIQEAVVTRAPL